MFKTFTAILLQHWK